MEQEIIKTLQTFLEKCNTKEEHDKIVDSVAPKMETAAALFAKNIISHRI